VHVYAEERVARVRACNSSRSQWSSQNYWTKNVTPSMCLATLAYVYVQLCSMCYYWYGSIIPTGFKFTELHALTLAACSYALLIFFKGCSPWAAVFWPSLSSELQQICKVVFYSLLTLYTGKEVIIREVHSLNK